MTKSTPEESKQQRYKALAVDSNRMYAYAIVYGEHTTREAQQFGLWVMLNGYNFEEPADALDLWHRV